MLSRDLVNAEGGRLSWAETGGTYRFTFLALAALPRPPLLLLPAGSARCFFFCRRKMAPHDGIHVGLQQSALVRHRHCLLAASPLLPGAQLQSQVQ